MKNITISTKEYEVLKKKATAYDEATAARRNGALVANAKPTPKQRSERARKAVAARWAKNSNRSTIKGLGVIIQVFFPAPSNEGGSSFAKKQYEDTV